MAFERMDNPKHGGAQNRGAKGAYLSITKNGIVALSPELMAAAGRPRNIALYFDSATRTLGLKAEEGPHTYLIKQKAPGQCGRFSASLFCSRYKVPVGVPLRVSFDGSWQGFTVSLPA